MRRFIVVLFLIAISNQLFSQSDLGFAPVGTVWHYSTHVSGGSVGHEIYTVTKDTIIKGKVCSEITVTGNRILLTSGVTNPFYVHYDSNRIYWQNRASEEFDLLYDFNAEVGDSWQVRLQCDSANYPWIFSDSITYHVDSTYMDTLNSLTLKVLVLSVSPNNINQSTNIHVAEMIGGLSYSYPHNFNCGGFGLHQWNGSLRCYDDSAFGQYIWRSPCDVLQVDLEEEMSKNEIRIHPIPADQILTIQTSDKMEFVEILDLTGNTLFQTGNESQTLEIDISDLPNGLYNVSIITKSGIQETRKIIIQH